MRLLNTTTGQFVWVADPHVVRYAILSHTWRCEEEGGEQSYEDVRELQSLQTARTSKRTTRLLARFRKDPGRRIPFLSHPALSDKIKEFCRIARDAGYELIWIDSCCIDKSSSAELSEAINSMYQWYRLAEVCYAYLADVPDGDKPSDPDSAFRASRWCTRGWTLQELVAPRRLVFLTQTWRFLGTKMGLSSTLEAITGIDFEILTGTAKLESVSIARRMSWASRRKTTRVEDEAYCLMGLFGVHLATIYGEGRNAFFRLQEEIIKTIPDQSIFAWGRSCTVNYNRVAMARAFVPPPLKPTDPLEACGHELGLLALSPRDFESARDVAPIPLEEFASRLSREPDALKLPTLHCLFTPQGVRLRLILIDLSAELSQISEVLFELHYGGYSARSGPYLQCTRQGECHSLALLRCQDAQGSLVALPLCRLPAAGPTRVQEPFVISTHAACPILEHLQVLPRTIRLGTVTLATARAQLSGPRKIQEVYIHRHYSPALYDKDRSSTLLPLRSFGHGVTANLSPESIEELHSLGFSTSALKYSYSEVHTTQTLVASVSVRCIEHPADGTQHGDQDINVGVILTNRAPESQPSTTAHFSVDHFFRKPFLGRGKPAATPGPRTESPSSAWDYLNLEEVPCADDSGGRRTSIMQQTESGVLHAQAEFLLHADADRESDGVDTRLLRVAVRGACDEPSGNVFQFSVELSQRHGPKGPGGELPRRVPPAKPASPPNLSMRDGSDLRATSDLVAEGVTSLPVGNALCAPVEGSSLIRDPPPAPDIPLGREDWNSSSDSVDWNSSLDSADCSSSLD